MESVQMPNLSAMEKLKKGFIELKNNIKETISEKREIIEEKLDQTKEGAYMFAQKYKSNKEKVKGVLIIALSVISAVGTVFNNTDKELKEFNSMMFPQQAYVQQVNHNDMNYSLASYPKQETEKVDFDFNDFAESIGKLAEISNKNPDLRYLSDVIQYGDEKIKTTKKGKKKDSKEFERDKDNNTSEYNQTYASIPEAEEQGANNIKSIASQVTEDTTQQAITARKYRGVEYIYIKDNAGKILYKMPREDIDIYINKASRRNNKESNEKNGNIELSKKTEEKDIEER